MKIFYHRCFRLSQPALLNKEKLSVENPVMVSIFSTDVPYETSPSIIDSAASKHGTNRNLNAALNQVQFSLNSIMFKISLWSRLIHYRDSCFLLFSVPIYAKSWLQYSLGVVVLIFEFLKHTYNCTIVVLPKIRCHTNSLCIEVNLNRALTSFCIVFCYFRHYIYICKCNSFYFVLSNAVFTVLFNVSICPLFDRNSFKIVGNVTLY